MYLEGTIIIDPSTVTQIKPIMPTKAFRKFLYHISLGKLSEKEEQETFAAVSILQQLNQTFRALNITNIIKLSHDDIDFYHDKEGKENDLKEALDKYEIRVDESMSTYFNQLNMVLEHDNSDFKFLIEVVINRVHKVGIYPIEIKISGLFKKFKSTDKETLEKEIRNSLKDQATFDELRNVGTQKFELFIDEVKLELKKHLSIDEIESRVKTKIILPKNKKVLLERKGTRTGSFGGGIHDTYFGFGDFILYSFIWSEIMHDSHIQVNDAYYETQDGEDIGYADEISSDADIFDSETDTDFEVCTDFRNDPEPFNEDVSTDDSSSWFDSFTDTDSWFDSDSFSGCSGCSGCSSCGGD